MIRVRVSDTQYRWLSPHRILMVSADASAPYVSHHNPPIGINEHEMTQPFKSQIRYETGNPNWQDRIYAHETPEEIAAMVSEAMRPIQIESRS